LRREARDEGDGGQCGRSNQNRIRKPTWTVHGSWFQGCSGRP